MKRILIALGLLTTALSVVGQQRVSEFSGIPMSANAAVLSAAGFLCAPAPGGGARVQCVDDSGRGVAFGVPLSRREALLVEDKLILISGYSQSTTAPGTLIQSLVGLFDGSFKRTNTPRFLEASNNQGRIFWSAGNQVTLAVSTVPMANTAGQPVVRFAMFAPAAH